MDSKFTAHSRHLHPEGVFLFRRKSVIAILIAEFFICIAVSLPAFASDTISADEALKLLQEGNARFVKMKLQHPNISIMQRKNTAIDGQNPFAIVLACSDSRVPVETIFDRGIGDIFVIRVAGNIVMDSDVVGSIEYGAEHLHCPLLVILGHTQCGAVKAAITGVHVEGSIRDIQKKIEPVAMLVKKEHPELRGLKLTKAIIKTNTHQAKCDILSRSQLIKKLSDAGKLKILTGVYDIKSGNIEWIK